jgi:hypothetical protein
MITVGADAGGTGAIVSGESGTVDDFVAVQSLLVQQRSTSLNTPRVSY